MSNSDESDTEWLPTRAHTRAHTPEESILPPPPPTTAGKKRHVVDDDVYEDGMRYVKKHRQRVVSVGEKLDILCVHLQLRHEHWLQAQEQKQQQQQQEQQQKKRGRPKNKAVLKGSFDVDVGKLLKRGTSITHEIWSDFINDRTPKKATLEGPRGKKHTAFDDVGSLDLKVKVKIWLRARIWLRKRTVAKDVLQYLCELGVFQENALKEDEKLFRVALRKTQRFIARMGFKRGTKANKVGYKEKTEALAKRDEYVLKMLSDDTAGRRVVYMDESYVHHHYALHNDSIYDPDDVEALTSKKKLHKGKRFCMIGAIISRNPDVDDTNEDIAEIDKAHFMMDTLDVFKGGKYTEKQKSKDLKDYHGMFTHKSFVGWVKRLLATLKKENITNTIIVMDNAKYHKGLPDDTPRKGMTKSLLQEACVARNIHYEPNESRAMLWAKLEPVVDRTPVVVKLAREAGHELIFSPPHYSDLQPIELVWAIVKAQVGRQYVDSSSMDQVEERLLNAFKSLKSRSVAGCIRKSFKFLHDIKEMITSPDNDEEDVQIDTDSSDYNSDEE